MEDTAHQQPLHVAVFPFLAFGHMIPFMELAKAIATKGHKVSFLSTPRNIQRLPKIPADIALHVDLVELHLPAVDDLPEGAEATTDLASHQVQYLKVAIDGLADQLAEFLRNASPKPKWILHDFAHHWLSSVAAGSGVLCCFFSAFCGPGLVFPGPPAELLQPSRKEPEDFTKPPEWVTFPSTVALKLHEAKGFVHFYDVDVSGFSTSSRLGSSIKNCKLIGVRSCQEFEPEWLNLAEKVLEKKVVPVGLLAPVVQPVTGDSEVLQWLDKKEKKSVVYVALGSEAVLSVELLHQLALGLEMSQFPFLWALRKPRELPEEESGLPEGFEERTRGRGFVTTGWVPQLNILAHGSVGGFLCHSGWSSVIEALRFGVPLVSLCVFGDQILNSRAFAEKKIVLEVERNDEDGYFTKEEVAKAVRMVMVEEEGVEFRTMAKKMMTEIFGDRELQDRYVDGFIQVLRDYKH